MSSIWTRRRDSNTRLSVLRTVAVGHLATARYMAGGVGLEPTTSSLTEKRTANCPTLQYLWGGKSDLHRLTLSSQDSASTTSASANINGGLKG